MAFSLDLSPRTKELLEKIQSITSIGDQGLDSPTNREPLLNLYIHLLEVISVLQEVDDAVKNSSYDLVRTLSNNKYNSNNVTLSKQDISELSTSVLPGLVGAIGKGFTELLLKEGNTITDDNNNNDEDNKNDDDNDDNNSNDLDKLDKLMGKNQALSHVFREEIAKRFPNILSRYHHHHHYHHYHYHIIIIIIRRHKSTGQTLLHYVAEKARTGPSGRQSLELLLEYMPKDIDIGPDSRDNFGALPLHWATRNSSISMDLLHGIIAAHPEAPMVKDKKGYLPIHWAVSIDNPDMYTIGLLLSIHPGGAATPCIKGNLPLHIAVNRQSPSSEVVTALLHIFPEAAKMHCKKGWLPIHRCVNRPNPNPQIVKMLLDIYPKGIQFTNATMSLPIHCLCGYPDASAPIIQKLIDLHPLSLSVADEYGYLPLHCMIDNYNPNTKLVLSTLQQYPEAAMHRTKDGFLPLHLIISSNKNPSLDIVGLLLDEYPDAINFAVEDKIPDNDTNTKFKGPLEEYQGPWKNHTWTPLTMAIERNLIGVIAKIKEKMKANKSMSIDIKQGNVDTSSSSSLSLINETLDKGLISNLDLNQSSYVSKRGGAAVTTKKFGGNSKSNSNGNRKGKDLAKVGIALGDDTSSHNGNSDGDGYGGFGEKLRGSLDSLDNNNDNSFRIVKTSVNTEPLNDTLKPLSMQLEKSGMLMDTATDGISLTNTNIPKGRPKLAPISSSSFKSLNTLKSYDSGKSNTVIDINDFDDDNDDNNDYDNEESQSPITLTSDNYMKSNNNSISNTNSISQKKYEHYDEASVSSKEDI